MALLVLGMVVSLRRWGRTADALGNRLVFLLNTAIMTLSFLLLSLVPDYAGAPWASIVVTAVASSVAGFVLDRFPALIELGGFSLRPIRVYFAAMALLLLLTAPMVRRLSRVRERPLRESLRGFAPRSGHEPSSQARPPGTDPDEVGQD